jgi:hypothetical protein
MGVAKTLSGEGIKLRCVSVSVAVATDPLDVVIF